MADDGPMTFTAKPTSPMNFGRGTSVWAEGKNPRKRAETLPLPAPDPTPPPPPRKRQPATSYLKALQQAKATR